MTAKEVIAHFNLTPHPREGGFYRETYRAADAIPASALPGRYSGPRAASTAIYSLLTPTTISRLHRVRSDELWHFYMGDPVTMLLLHPDGSGRTVTLGHEILHGQYVQYPIPAGTWFGTRLHRGENFALLGITVAPGFDFADFEIGRREELIAQYPGWREAITALTVEK